MTILTKALDKVIKACEWIVIVLLALSVVDIGVQVFCRYVIGSPLPWTEQVARYMFIWMTMLGLPMLFKRGYTLAFTLIFDAMPNIAQLIIDVLIKLVGMGFSGFYFWHSIEYCVKAGTKLASGIQVPLNVVYTSLPVGAGLMFLVLFDQMICDFIRTARSKKELKGEN